MVPLTVAGYGIRIEYMLLKFGSTHYLRIIRYIQGCHIILATSPPSILTILTIRMKERLGVREVTSMTSGTIISRIAALLGLSITLCNVNYKIRTWRNSSLIMG